MRTARRRLVRGARTTSYGPVSVNTGEDLLADILHLAAQVDVVAALAHVVIRALRRVRRRVG